MEDKSNEHTMCLLPWDAAAIRPFSTALPCCRFILPNNISFAKESRITNDFRNSPTWVKTRKMMLEGTPIPECAKCYREESSGAPSMRTFSLKYHRGVGLPIPTDIEVLPLRFLEIAFSNLCNLACVSCGNSYSSTWATEDYKHGRLPKGQKALVQHNNDLTGMDLSQVTVIKIIGGEPFMDQDRFIHLLKRLNLQNLTIRISTNGTVLPNNELKSLIDQCKNVVLDVSLDGVGSVDEWYRWPTNFTEKEKIMNQYQEWWGDKRNALLQVHSVINAYNIWNLNEMVLYMNNNFPSWGMDFDWITIPAWQSIAVIPDELKAELKTKLLEWDSTIKANTRFEKSPPFSVSILRLDDTPNSTWDTFKGNTFSLADERKINVLEMVPHLKIALDKLSQN
jgi:sulfatase maturation enzyme AslB (radical SAM superfamily)